MSLFSLLYPCQDGAGGLTRLMYVIGSNSCLLTSRFLSYFVFAVLFSLFSFCYPSALSALAEVRVFSLLSPNLSSTLIFFAHAYARDRGEKENASRVHAGNQQRQQTKPYPSISGQPMFVFPPLSLFSGCWVSCRFVCT